RVEGHRGIERSVVEALGHDVAVNQLGGWDTVPCQRELRFRDVHADHARDPSEGRCHRYAGATSDIESSRGRRPPFEQQRELRARVHRARDRIGRRASIVACNDDALRIVHAVRSVARIVCVARTPTPTALRTQAPRVDVPWTWGGRNLARSWWVR